MLALSGGGDLEMLRITMRQPGKGLRLLCGLLLAAVLAPTQPILFRDLREAVGRMVRLNVPDAQIAARLRRVQPIQQVPAGLAEEAAIWGAGPLTQRELRTLAEKSVSKAPSGEILGSVQGRPGQFPIEEGEPSVILEAIRLYAAEYSQSIPNFLCFRNTQFMKDKTGLGRWEPHLHLRERMVHQEDGDHHEIVAVDGKEVDGQVMIFHGGITVSGEFGNIIRRIFEEKTKTRFYWIGDYEEEGERRVAIAFEVDQQNSSMEMSSGRKSVKTGYRGELVAAPDTGQIFRIRLAQHNPPKDFPIRGASWDIRYAPVKVEAQELLLPVKAITEAYQSAGFMRNEATYTDYQKYAAESSIQFDVLPDEEPDDDSEPDPNSH